MAVLNAAMDGTGIAQYGPVVTVLSPDQNNFEMAPTVEPGNGPVADDVKDWEEAFEVWLNLDETRMQFQGPTPNGEIIPAPDNGAGAPRHLAVSKSRLIRWARRSWSRRVITTTTAPTTDGRSCRGRTSPRRPRPTEPRLVGSHAGSPGVVEGRQGDPTCGQELHALQAEAYRVTSAPTDS